MDKDQVMILRDPSSASKKEVALLIREIIDTIKEKSKMLSEIVSNSNSDCEKMCGDMQKELQSHMKEIKSMMSEMDKDMSDKWYKELNAEVYKLEKLISEVPQFNSSQIEAKFSEVISEVVKDLQSKIDAIKPFILTGEEVVDKINDLSIIPENQIGKEHIKGLQEEIETLRKEISNIPRGGGRGGGSGNSVQYHDITSELNGSTKSFIIPKHRRVIAVISSSSPWNFRPVVDYTIAGRTLTFTDAIDAESQLPYGQTITVLYVGLFNII